MDIRVNPITSTDIRAQFAQLTQRELPTTYRNLVNDMAFDLRGRVVEEMRRVFDRPKPQTLKLPRIKRKATAQNPVAELWVTDFGGGADRRDISRAIPPHVPGEPDTREHKGMERWLLRSGRMKAGEWLMPSRFIKLDQYGNVPGSVAAKMLADVGVYGGLVSGFEGDTKTYDRYRSAGRRRRVVRGKKLTYYWLEVQTAGKAGTVKGIWRKVGSDLVPQMVVVRTRPRYGKRFRLAEMSRTYLARRLGYHAGRVFAQTVGRR